MNIRAEPVSTHGVTIMVYSSTACITEYLSWPGSFCVWFSLNHNTNPTRNALPLTNMSRVRFPNYTSHVGWICWFSTLLPDVLGIFPLLKNKSAKRTCMAYHVTGARLWWTNQGQVCPNRNQARQKAHRERINKQLYPIVSYTKISIWFELISIVFSIKSLESAIIENCKWSSNYKSKWRYLLKLRPQSAEWQVKGQSRWKTPGWQHFPIVIPWRLSSVPDNSSPFKYKSCRPVGHSAYPSLAILAPNVELLMHSSAREATMTELSINRWIKVSIFMVVASELWENLLYRRLLFSGIQNREKFNPCRIPLLDYVILEPPHLRYIGQNDNGRAQRTFSPIPDFDTLIR